MAIIMTRAAITFESHRVDALLEECGRAERTVGTMTTVLTNRCAEYERQSAAQRATDDRVRIAADRVDAGHVALAHAEGERDALQRALRIMGLMD